MSTLAFFIQNIGPFEAIALLALGLLLFGKRLPEVGKSLGKGIVEFKRGLKGVSDEIEEESNRSSSQPKAELPAAEKPAQPWVQPPAHEVRVSQSDKVE